MTDEPQLPVGPDGDEDEAPEVPESDSMPSGGKRMDLLKNPEFELSPGSLVGSWFHRLENGVIVWDGCVVGEVQPGKYLCQVRRGLDGIEKSQAQRVVPVEKMTGLDEGYEFRFYDSRDEMIEAYAEYVVNQEAWRE